jgi:hypothetical protein
VSIDPLGFGVRNWTAFISSQAYSMPNIALAGDLLPLVGTPAFLPSLLSYIRNSSSGTLPLDPVIFQAILLCILAGDKHLLLHTPEEDVGLVARLAAWVSSALFQVVPGSFFVGDVIATSTFREFAVAIRASARFCLRCVAFPRDVHEA